MINKFIFDLHGNKKWSNELSEKANLFIKCFKKMNINLHKNSNTLINYLLDGNLFQTKIFSKLKLSKRVTLNEDLYYILFYAIKLVISIQANQNNIYADFYRNKTQIINALSSKFFPCCFPQNIEQINSYYEIEEHLKTQAHSFAIYIYALVENIIQSVLAVFQ